MSQKTQTISEKQLLAWKLRHERGWSLERIGRKFGVSRAAIGQMLRRTPSHAPLKPSTARWRVVRPFSLSDVFNA